MFTHSHWLPTLVLPPGTGTNSHARVSINFWALSQLPPLPSLTHCPILPTRVLPPGAGGNSHARVGVRAHVPRRNHSED